MMRSSFAAVAGLVALAACAPLPQQPTNSPPQRDTPAWPPPGVAAGPCADSAYVALKAKDLDEMSDREFAIFQQRDKACLDYQSETRITAAAKKQAESTEKAGSSVSRAIITAFVVVPLVAGIIVAMASGTN